MMHNFLHYVEAVSRKLQQKFFYYRDIHKNLFIYVVCDICCVWIEGNEF